MIADIVLCVDFAVFNREREDKLFFGQPQSVHQMIEFALAGLDLFLRIPGDIFFLQNTLF